MEVLLTKDYILRLLEKKGMSKSDFAKSMGYKRQNVDTMLESKKKDINTIIKIAEVLDMPLEEFIFGKNSYGGVRVSGFVKVNDSIIEVKNKTDLKKILSDIDNLEEGTI